MAVEIEAGVALKEGREIGAGGVPVGKGVCIGNGVGVGKGGAVGAKETGVGSP